MARQLTCDVSEYPGWQTSNQRDLTPDKVRDNWVVFLSNDNGPVLNNTEISQGVLPTALRLEMRIGICTRVRKLGLISIAVKNNHTAVSSGLRPTATKPLELRAPGTIGTCTGHDSHQKVVEE